MVFVFHSLNQWLSYKSKTWYGFQFLVLSNEDQIKNHPIVKTLPKSFPKIGSVVTLENGCKSLY